MKSYEIRKEIVGENDLLTIKSLEGVAWAEMRLGEYKKAEGYYR